MSGPLVMMGLVPARGGSRGVIGKNLARLGGNPMLLATIDVLSQVESISRVILSTDDHAIRAVGQVRGVELHARPDSLANAEATLAQVALHVIDQFGFDGELGVFQPTSPLRSANSVELAIAAFRDSGADSLASVVRETSLFWWDEHGDPLGGRPLHTERVNRQYGRHHVLRETGSIQLVKTDVLRRTGQLVGDNHYLFETPPGEAIDVNSFDELLAARRRAERGTVVFRVRANRSVGYGHLYHALSLAEELQSHEIRFLLRDCDREIEEILGARGWSWISEADPTTSLDDPTMTGSRVLVNDILDTTPEDVLPALILGYRVVNIEDLGPGAAYADLVINALYGDGPARGALTGPAYTTLRPEFSGLPEKTIRDQVQRLLVTFGGADPANLSGRVGAALVGQLDCELRLIQGPGSRPVDVEGVEVIRSSANVAEEMLEADIVITSAGRTVYEAAATGTPVIVVAQNSREATHSHLNMDQGVLYLGIGALVDDAHLINVVRRLAADVALRADLSARLRRGIDTKGAQRIAHRLEAMINGLE